MRARANRASGRLHRVAAVVLLSLFGGSAVHAEDLQQQVRQILGAAKSKDVPRLQKLIAEAKVDPWLAVDLLAATGHAALTRAVPGAAQSKALNEYAAGADGRGVSSADVRQQMEISRLLREKKYRSLPDVADLPAPAARSATRAHWHYARGFGLHYADRATMADAALEQAASEARAIGWAQLEYRALTRQIRILARGVRYRRTRAVQVRRAQLLAAANRQKSLDKVRLNIAVVDLALGNTDAALPALAAGIARLEAEGQRSAAAHLRLQRALALSNLGSYAKALDECDKAHATYAALKRDGVLDDAMDLAYAMQVMATILLDLGRPAAARDLFVKLITEGTSADPVHDLVTLANAAMCEARLGRSSQTAALFGRAFAIARRPPGDALLPDLLILRGRDLHERFGLRAKAHIDFDAAFARASKGSKQQASAALGLARTHGGEVADARVATWAEAARRIAEDLRDRDLQAQAHAVLSSNLIARGKPREALAHALKGVRALEVASERLADDEMIALRSDADRAAVYQALLRSAHRTKDSRSVFRAMETTRAQALLRAFGGSQAIRGQGLTPEAVVREREARAELEEALDELQRHRAADDLLAAVTARKRVDAAERQLVTALSAADRADRRRSAAAYPQIQDLDEFKRTLEPKTVMIQVAELPEVWMLLRVAKESPTAQFSWSKDWFDRVRDDALWPRSIDADERAFFGALDKLAAQFRALVPPGTRQVLVSPDGFLAAVPWSILSSRALGGLKVHLMPSASTLVAIRGNRNHVGKRSLLVGDPAYHNSELPLYIRGRLLRRLRGSGDEVQKIRRPQDVVLTRKLATEAAVKAELASSNRWNVVHLACHGFVDPVTPSMSSLALGRSSGDDGFLTAIEVFRLDVRADLVVLSACDVGKDAVQSGEGMLGVVRAFMAAGARRVLASLWPADDRATSQLMQVFYKERARGLSDFEALQAAQADVRDFEDDSEERPWSHPFYWAGWVLWGAP